MITYSINSTTEGTNVWLPVNIQISTGYWGVVTLYFSNYGVADAVVDAAVCANGDAPTDADLIAPQMSLPAPGSNTNTGEVKSFGLLPGQRLHVRMNLVDVNCHAQAIAQPITAGVSNA